MKNNLIGRNVSVIMRSMKTIIENTVIIALHLLAHCNTLFRETKTDALLQAHGKRFKNYIKKRFIYFSLS